MDTNLLFLEAILPCYSDRRDPKGIAQYILNRHKLEQQYARDFLMQNEAPKAIVPCSLDSKYHQYDESVDGLLVATDIRVIFVGKTGFNFLGNAKPFYREFRYGSMGSIEYIKSWAFRSAKVIIHVLTTSATGSVTEIIFSCGQLTNGTQHLANFARSRMSNLSTTPKQHQEVAYPSESNASWIAEIERLAKLREKDLITEEEFSTAKKKLLLE